MNKKIKILAIEDDPYISDLITLYSKKNGFTVSVADDGMLGLEMYYNSPPDLVILDIMIPEIDGWDVCKEIRRFDDRTPIIMLTGKGESYDKLMGFELGTDDYLVKPFDPNELMARIKALLRRANLMLEANEIVEFPMLMINLKEYKVTCEKQVIVLPPKEMELLYFLALHPNQVFTRHQLLEQIWGFDFEGDPRTVDVHIKRIREKLGDTNPYWKVKTIRGVGYKFEVNNQ